ncbi:MAG: STN domain-containing protein [Planctomycetes bacterium]|nr:STN domain-containing protein [Planctomycetota bacterium]
MMSRAPFLCVCAVAVLGGLLITGNRSGRANDLVSQATPAPAEQAKPIPARPTLPTNEAAPQKAGSRRDPTPAKHREKPAEAKIRKALNLSTNVEWTEFPLEDCITYLADFHGINIVVEKQALAEERVGLDEPITLRLQQAALESILNLLLDPYDLQWVIQDEVLKITTRTWCEDRPEVSVHPIQSLIKSGHVAEDVMATIKVCIDPGSWSPKDGFAGMAYTGGVLVVRQTQRNHSEIARLLSDLEDMAEQTVADQPHPDPKTIATIKVYSTGEQPPEKVASVIQEFVEPRSWEPAGGGMLQTLNGSLVVKQTPDVHRAIQRFLSQIELKSTPAAPDLQPKAGTKSADADQTANVVPGGDSSPHQMSRSAHRRK